MNFFQHQDDARKKTWQLIALFVLAVISLVILTSLFIASFLYFFQMHAGTSIQLASNGSVTWIDIFTRLFQSREIVWIVTGVCLVVAAGSTSKYIETQKGGSFIAESLGARLLVAPANEYETVLINVVEEMAIASGASVPSIYIINDQSINAFAAGNQSSDAVIGVTEGCIKILSRAQLQGVIAHEFSHIQHGDMRLNMRLLALLHGIVAIGQIGEMLARSSGSTGFHRHRRRNKNQTALLGLGLIGIGFCGTFFGNLIRSAVTRQREFLADASAVQYTRNPQGIAGALQQIKARNSASFLTTGSAKQFSHFYFSEGTGAFLGGVFSSHPPLDLRISRILGRHYEAQNLTPTSATELHGNKQRTIDYALSSLTSSCFGSSSALNIDSTAAQAEAFESDWDKLHAYSQNPYTSRAIVFALLVDQEKSQLEEQKRYLKAKLHPASFKEFETIHPLVNSLKPDARFALLQLCQRALKTLSDKQRDQFISQTKSLITFDGRLGIEEWASFTFIYSTLKRKRISENKRMNDCKAQIVLLLRFITELNTEESRKKAFSAAVIELWPNDHKTDYPTRANIGEINRTLTTLKQLKALEKPKLIKALALCSNYDARLSTNEQITLKAIAASLNCPISLS